MSVGVLSPLNNNASMGAMNEYSVRAPPLLGEQKNVFGNSKISREDAPSALAKLKHSSNHNITS